MMNIRRPKQNTIRPIPIVVPTSESIRAICPWMLTPTLRCNGCINIASFCIFYATEKRLPVHSPAAFAPSLSANPSPPSPGILRQAKFFVPAIFGSTSSKTARHRLRSAPTTLSVTARDWPTAVSSSARKTAPPMACASTWTAICGAAGGRRRP
jgi:hypothetical protein